MERDIDRLTGHYIICGADALAAAQPELARRPAQFVIIENNEAKAQKFAGENWLVMVGDATQNRLCAMRKSSVRLAWWPQPPLTRPIFILC